MHCRDFKDKHVAFVDETVAGVELVEMQQHLDECPHCARQDAKIRRALLLVRNLPVIELSPKFSERLEARLAESRATPLVGHRIRKRMAAAAILGAAAMIGYIAITLDRVESSHDLMMAPVVASTVEPEMSPLASPPAAILASAPAGLAIWPAAMFAEQAPVHFARARFSNANVTH